MTITKSYIEGLSQRIELVRKAFDEKQPEWKKEMHIFHLIGYLEGLDYFVEEEKKMTCETCGRPLYTRKDGSLVCVELHH
jgi:hypothetical protein